jgi:hypothetical protein
MYTVITVKEETKMNNMDKITFAVEHAIPIVCKYKLQKIEVEEKVRGMTKVYTTEEWLKSSDFKNHKSFILLKER